jgi:hypothetical protein
MTKRIERLASALEAGPRRRVAGPSPATVTALKLLIKGVIADSWTTAEDSWKVEAVKNLKVKGPYWSGGKLGYFLTTSWNQGPDYAEPVGEASWTVSVKDMAD